VKVRNPIGMLYVEALGVVFVGSKKSKKKTGAVYAVNATSLQWVRTYTLLGGR